jgi:hypothetical protein
MNRVLLIILVLLNYGYGFAQDLRWEEYLKNKKKEEFIKIKSPLLFTEALVSFNSIGTPEANLSFNNISDKDIDAFEITILCYDNYDRPVNHYLYKTNVFTGIYQDIIKPDESSFCLWTLYGYDNTTKIKAVLKSVHYKGKGVWYPKNKISIKSN